MYKKWVELSFAEGARGVAHSAVFSTSSSSESFQRFPTLQLLVTDAEVHLGPSLVHRPGYEANLGPSYFSLVVHQCPSAVTLIL